jgi:hypothetical protein
MKKIFFALCTFLFMLQMEAKSPASPFVQTIFDHLKVKTTLEFGLSEETNYFLESSTKVISIEFITNGYGPESLKAAIEKKKSYSNWIPIAFFSGFHGDVNWAPYRYYGSESVYKATSHMCATHQSFAGIDDFYLTELNSFINNLKKCYKIDVAHIGGSILLRGDLVQILFGKVPVIIGTGTHYPPQDLFGYNNLTVPSDYEAIVLPQYQTTIWISQKEEFKALTEDLRKLAF